MWIAGVDIHFWTFHPAPWSMVRSLPGLSGCGSEPPAEPRGPHGPHGRGSPVDPSSMARGCAAMSFGFSWGLCLGWIFGWSWDMADMEGWADFFRKSLTGSWKMGWLKQDGKHLWMVLEQLAQFLGTKIKANRRNSCENLGQPPVVGSKRFGNLQWNQKA